MHGQRREDRSLRKFPVPSPESKSTPGEQTGVLLFECSPREAERLQGRSSLWRSFGWQGPLRYYRAVQNPNCLSWWVCRWKQRVTIQVGSCVCHLEKWSLTVELKQPDEVDLVQRQSLANVKPAKRWGFEPNLIINPKSQGLCHYDKLLWGL